MKKTKLWFGILALLALVICVATAGHFLTRPQTAKAALSVELGEGTVQLPLDSLPYQPVEGTVVNGKQETTTVSGQGAALREVLALAGADTEALSAVTVLADDSYSAEISGEELCSNDGIYLMQEEDELRLVVFGDPNRKRNVSHVVLVKVTP